MVQQVKRFGTEFEIQPLGNGSEFRQPGVESSISRASNCASARISELAKRLKLKRIRVEPFVWRLRPRVGIPNLVGAVTKCPSFTLVVSE